MIIFRADGNREIGLGHVMRCLSIAKEAMKSEEVLFVTADEKAESLIKRSGIRNEILYTDFADMSGEEKALLEIIQHEKPSALFVDSYQVTEPYLLSLLAACRRISCKLVYLDDMLRFAYPCNILINYNLFGMGKEQEYARIYENAERSLPMLLLGPMYTPLREEFQDLEERHVKKKASDILVSTGGADSEHIALKMLDEIIRIKPAFYFHFIIGPMNTDKALIERKVNSAHSENIRLHYDVQHMSELMRSCDIAIAAAGSTLYELCTTQTPTLTYVLADNQIPGADGFESHGIMKNMGDLRKGSNLIRRLIEESVLLADDYERRKRIADRMKHFFDGNGCKRILSNLL